jgi:hypothetical protein
VAVCDALEDHAGRHNNDNDNHDKDSLVQFANNASLTLSPVCRRIGNMTIVAAAVVAATNPSC